MVAVKKEDTGVEGAGEVSYNSIRRKGAAFILAILVALGSTSWLSGCGGTGNDSSSGNTTVSAEDNGEENNSGKTNTDSDADADSVTTDDSEKPDESGYTAKQRESLETKWLNQVRNVYPEMKLISIEQDPEDHSVCIMRFYETPDDVTKKTATKITHGYKEIDKALWTNSDGTPNQDFNDDPKALWTNSDGTPNQDFNDDLDVTASTSQDGTSSENKGTHGPGEYSSAKSQRDWSGSRFAAHTLHLHLKV